MNILQNTIAVGTLMLAPMAALHATDLPKPASRPNIVFILSDDHSLQTIGSYNARLSEFCRQQKVTPNIDRLAAEGALFANSFCCNSLCSPSRAAILTGLHSGSNGVLRLDEPIRSGVWTFPGAVGAAGYQTAVVGKWHLADTPTNTDYWQLLTGQGDYWNPTVKGPKGDKKLTGYATEALTDVSLDWLKARDKSKPFMLMLYHKAPHRPWTAPPRYYKWLADVTIPEPPTLFDDYAGRGKAAHLQHVQMAKTVRLGSDLQVYPPGKGALDGQPKAEWEEAYGPRNEAFFKAKLQGKDLVRWEYQEYMKQYLRCVKAVDDSVGTVLDYLKAEGLDKNTVVIYASDQGIFNGEHGWFNKRWIYEESVHMPFIIRWPAVIKPGLRPAQFIQNIDYAPTFVEMAGGKVPDTLHGRSMLPILRGESPADWRKSIYYHYYDEEPSLRVTRHYGIRSDRFTLVNFYPLKEWELYDNQKDPQQMRNVYSDPEYAQIVPKLKTELEQLRQQYDHSFNPEVVEPLKPKTGKKSD